MLTADTRQTDVRAAADFETAAGDCPDSRNRFVVGLLIPEFPEQTHCAWWRVGNAMRRDGVEMQMLSSRRPTKTESCHDFLVAESKQTYYCWPPSWGRVAGTWLRHPSVLWKGLRYLAGLSESSLREKLKLAPLVLAATGLRRFAEQRGIDAIFVHSCANAAHLVAMCREMGGPRYALRLGGHLEVYGKDHRSKMRGAMFIASSSPTFYPDLQQRAGLAADRLMWTWVGVDVEKYTPGDRSWQRQNEEELHVVTVARLNRTKGHEDVFQAIATLQQRGIKIRYRLVGAGPYEAQLRAAADELGIGDRVEFLGSKGADDVIDLLRRSDVAVLASHSKGEAAPAVVCESMACGVPVICTRIGATQEMIEDGVNGWLVPQHDPAAIADCLEKLAVNEPTRETMAREAYKHSRLFDCREVANTLLSRMGYDPAETLMETPDQPTA